MNVAFEHHRFLIGRSGETIRSLMQAHDVNISIPPEDTHLDEIVITGTAENVESAVADILKRVGEFEEAAEIRVFIYFLSFNYFYTQLLSRTRGVKKSLSN